MDYVILLDELYLSKAIDLEMGYDYMGLFLIITQSVNQIDYGTQCF